MKIAIPSMDGTTISAHFGHSRYFLVLGVEDGLIASRELRINGQADGPGQGIAHTGEHHGHDHGLFARLLLDCDAVVCGGIGMEALRSLEAAGLRVCRVDPSLTPEEAARAYADGTLLERKGHSCGCSGNH